jgi:hypothetical protein
MQVSTILGQWVGQKLFKVIHTHVGELRSQTSMAFGANTEAMARSSSYWYRASGLDTARVAAWQLF